MTEFAVAARGARVGKPRLKYRDGGLLLLTPAAVPRTFVEARRLIKLHYGTIVAFSAKNGLRYPAVVDALRDDWTAATRAGEVAYIRQLLGLTSTPSEASRRMTEAYYRSRGLAAPWTWRSIA